MGLHALLGILEPLFIPLLATIVGGMAAYYACSRLRTDGKRGSRALAMAAMAIFASVIPNCGQTLSEIGLSFPAGQLLIQLSYALFGFGAVGAWLLLRPSWTRWLLPGLLPVAFYQPALWVFAFWAWTVHGFAP